MAPKQVRVSDDLITYLEKKLEKRIKQRDAIYEELALLDLRIDDFDKLIIEIDKEALGYSTEINDAINNLESKYNAKIDAGIKSKLVWQEIESPLNIGSQYKEYECVVDTTQQTVVNLSGLKYYRKPANKDYGADIVVDFNGRISAGSSILGVYTDTSISATGNNLDSVIDGSFEETFSTVRINDSIVDDIDNPVFFKSSDIPTVIGFGQTTYVAISTTPEYLIGGIPSNSTAFAHFGAGNTSNVVVGNYLIPEDTSIFGNDPFNFNPPKIIGFGQTQVTLEYYNASGNYTTNQFTCRSFLLDKPSTKYVQEGRFYIGIVSTLSAYFLSTVSLASTTYEGFTAYRYDDLDDKVEDIADLKRKKLNRKSPENPLRIGILDSSNLGKGSSLEWTDSGDPNKGEVKWNKYKYDREGRRDKEPEVGAGVARYNLGNTQHPTLPNGTYATKGQTIKVEGSITNSYYTNQDPPGTPNSTSYNNAISEAQTALDEVLSQGYDQLGKAAVDATTELRNERDDLEVYAWTLQNTAARVTKKIRRLERALTSLKNTNYVKYNLYKKVT